MVLKDDIVRHIKKGDKKSFRMIFEYYFNALCAFGYKYISDLSDVEDIVQEAFINFWEKRRNF
jgi:RNA polymerase sigma-70 factor (ECF subfamily)